jgi:CheY-like chemotaxis protein
MPHSRRVLVVDDDPLCTRILERVLRAEFEVHVSNDGADALQRILENEPYEAILCDLSMPGMDGMELHQALQRVAPEAARRVIFVTGGAFTEETQQFLASIENPQTSKPYDLREIRELLRLAPKTT